MIDFHRAIELEKKYYAEKGFDELTKVYDAEKIWVVFAGKIVGFSLKYRQKGQ